MHTTPALVAFTLLTLIGGAACSDAEATRTDWTVVQNRMWIERMPKDPRDMIKQLVLIDDDGERFGATTLCSRFRVFMDFVDWQGTGDELKLGFLQTKQEQRAKVRAWNCMGTAPAPFELCLELQDAKSKRVYFSRKDWEVGSLHDAEALTRALAAGTDDAPATASDDAASVDAPATY